MNRKTVICKLFSQGFILVNSVSALTSTLMSITMSHFENNYTPQCQKNSYALSYTLTLKNC